MSYVSKVACFVEPPVGSCGTSFRQIVSGLQTLLRRHTPQTSWQRQVFFQEGRMCHELFTNIGKCEWVFQ